MIEQDMRESESCSVISNSLRPHELYSPWNSPHQNTGVGSLSLPQGIFPTRESNPGLPHCRWFFTSWATREAQEHWSGYPVPSPVNLPNPGIELGSPELQVDSLPTELWGSKGVTLDGPKYSSNCGLGWIALVETSDLSSPWVFAISSGLSVFLEIFRDVVKLGSTQGQHWAALIMYSWCVVGSQ